MQIIVNYFQTDETKQIFSTAVSYKTSFEIRIAPKVSYLVSATQYKKLWQEL